MIIPAIAVALYLSPILKLHIMTGTDLHDSEKDKKELKADKTTIDLPEVTDIPVQENVKPPEGSQSENLTIASDDEEGAGIPDNDEDDAFILSDTSDVTQQEKELLKDSETVGTEDDRDLQRARLDKTDFEGDELNETGGQDGKDLDVPGQEDDDAEEETGEEDEENNEYSISDNQ